LEAVVFGLCFWWGTFTGRYHSLNDLPDKSYFITTAPDLYLWGRAFTAIIGASAILIIFWLVQRIWQDKLAAVLAAGFVACSSLLVENSHYIATDMPMATLALLAIYPCWRIMETGQRRYYIGAGIVIGLAIGTKYNSGLLIVMLMTAHLFYLARNTPDHEIPLLYAFKRILNGYLILSLVCLGLAFLATTPDFIANLRSYTDGIVTDYYKYRFADPSVGSSASATPWLTYLSAFWHDSPVVMVLALGGLLWLAYRHTRLDLLLLGFPLVYFNSFNALPLVYVRNGIAVLLFCQLWAALFASMLLKKVWQWWQKRSPQPLILRNYVARLAIITLALLGIVALAMFGSIRDSLYGNSFNNRPITYTVAEQWLKTVAGPTSLKLVEMRPQQWGPYPNTLAVNTNDDKNGADDHSLVYYQERGITYLAINDLRAQPSLKTGQGNYALIYQQSQLADHVLGKNAERLGPDFSILKTGATAQTLKLQHSLAISANFGQELQLLGFNLGVLSDSNQIYLPPDGPIKSDLPTFKPGQILGISLYWQTLQQPTHDYTVFIHVVPVGKPDTKVAQRDTPPLQGTWPTSKWQAGQLVTDEPNLALPADLAPGQYQIVLGLYQPDGNFTPLLLPNGQSSLVLATITVNK
jgi:hypothetical protein